MKSKNAKAKKAVKLYKIENGVKIPPVAKAVAATRAGSAALTLAKLEKGQSFLVKDALEAVRADKTKRGMMASERERGGTREFVSRKVGNGMRFWRAN